MTSKFQAMLLMIEYLFVDKLHQEYLKAVELKSTDMDNNFPEVGTWQEYKENKLKELVFLEKDDNNE